MILKALAAVAIAVVLGMVLFLVSIGLLMITLILIRGLGEAVIKLVGGLR